MRELINQGGMGDRRVLKDYLKLTFYFKTCQETFSWLYEKNIIF